MIGTFAYETLLLDSMQGDATLFMRRDEVEAAHHPEITVVGMPPPP